MSIQVVKILSSEKEEQEAEPDYAARLNDG
jgi:hypothetical protein